jgi:hypothetical protein
MTAEDQKQFFERADKIFIVLEKTRGWYKKMATTFAVSIVAVVFAAGAIGYRIGLMETAIQGKASIDAVRLLKDSNEGLETAIIGLINDKDHKDVANQLMDQIKIMNDNIFMFTTTRGATKDARK